MSSAAAHHFQFESASYQEQTAIAGMWLFLATEVLLFGGLILSWIVSRHADPLGFDAGAGQTDRLIGTVNTAILVTSSCAYTVGLAYMRAGNVRRLIQCCALTLLLGLAFLALKFGVEWHADFARHLFPSDPHFSVSGGAQGGARLFFVFYFIGTALHGAHMLIGVGLLGWIMVRARRGAFSARSHTPVHVVGLYWSFVDIVWLVLYPMIYLVGRG